MPKPPGAAEVNSLYTELIDLCAISKALYATTDAHKYADLGGSGQVDWNETGHPTGCPVVAYSRRCCLLTSSSGRLFLHGKTVTQA